MTDVDAMDAKPLAFIIGCTGSGKGSLGRELARRVGGEIVSLDSMKVYRRMDIGTAKPSAAVRQQIPHHLIDVVEPSEEFSVARYVELAERAIADIQQRGKSVFVIGGTPLYLKALTEGLFEGPGADEAVRSRLQKEARQYGTDTLHERLTEIDPQAAGRIHPNDLRRIVRALEVYELTGRPITELQAQWDRGRTRYDYVLIGLRRDRDDQNRRTNARAIRMIDDGLVDEVAGLLAESEPLSTAATQALGYAEVIQHLKGDVSLADAVEMIKINTRQFAKAQRTWFKRFRDTEWIDLESDAKVGAVADTILQRRGSLWSA
jgi:tRNA dimethylallyltransferase